MHDATTARPYWHDLGDEIRVSKPDHLTDAQWQQVTGALLEAGWERVTEEATA